MVLVCPEIKWKDRSGKEKEGYYLDGYAKQIGEAIADRVKKRKQDILVIFNGNEGSGKTNGSIAIGKYVSYLTGREFTNNQIFFNIDEMRKYAGETKEQIIIWDEAALGGLANDWSNFSQRKLIAMLMVCRKKRHVFIFSVPRFYRLSPKIIERAYCMFHIYENAKEQPGNFMFIGRDALENLYNEWQKTRRVFYWKYKKLHGCFTWVLPKLINEDEYEEKKDAAILKLANESEKEDKRDKIMETRKRILEEAKKEGWKDEKTAKLMGISISHLRNEKNTILKYEIK